MVEHYYRNVHAVVFVYDVTKMASFRNLQTWIEVSYCLIDGKMVFVKLEMVEEAEPMSFHLSFCPVSIAPNG